MNDEIEGQDVDKRLIELLRGITDEDVELFKKEFNDKYNYIKIGLKGARLLLQAKIEKQVYEEFNEK